MHFHTYHPPPIPHQHVRIHSYSLQTTRNDAENDKKILSLTPLQNAELIRQLVSSNPAAREAILALVPSIPSTPTQSRFLTSEVEKLAPSLSGGMWNGHYGCRSLLMDALDSTTGRMFVELRKVRNYHDDNSL